MSCLSLFVCQAVNNLAIAFLGQDKLKEGTQILGAALQTSPSTLAMAEPFLFNLCACFTRSSLYLFALPEHGAPTLRPRSTSFDHPSHRTRNVSCYSKSQNGANTAIARHASRCPSASLVLNPQDYRSLRDLPTIGREVAFPRE